MELAYVLWGKSEGTVDRTLETLQTFDPVTLTLGGTEYLVTPDDRSFALAVRAGTAAVEAPTGTPVPVPSAPAPPAVPEPATGLLALVGVAGLAARRWRGWPTASCS